MEQSSTRSRRISHWSRRNRGASPRAQDGFTLVELLVVFAILALLASLVAPRVIGHLSASNTRAAKI